jgi:hypothetical protein
MFVIRETVYAHPVHVTVNNTKVLSVAQQCFHGEFMLLATLKSA